MITLRHFRRGLPLGISIGIALGLTVLRQTDSTLRAVLTAALTASAGPFCQGLIEARGERRRLLRGITLSDPPVRPKLVLHVRGVPEHLVELCRDALKLCDIRIKRLTLDEPLRIAGRTRMSFFDGSQRIAIEAGAGAQGASILQISSVPWIGTVRVDGGVNYANVFLLSKYVKDRVGADALIEEGLVDLDAQE